MLNLPVVLAQLQVGQRDTVSRILCFLQHMKISYVLPVAVLVAVLDQSHQLLQTRSTNLISIYIKGRSFMHILIPIVKTINNRNIHDGSSFYMAANQ